MSGIYSANQFHVVVKAFLFQEPSLSKMITQSVKEYFARSDVSLEGKFIMCKSLLAFLKEASQNELSRFTNGDSFSKLTI